MTDTTEEDTTFRVDEYDPATLVMDENVRTDAAATVDGTFVASLKAGKGMLAPGAGNLIPILLKRLPGGTLRVHDGARRTIGCQRAGLLVAGIVTGNEGDTQADRRARILGQLLADERLSLPTSDRVGAVLTLFEDEGMTVAGIAKATGREKAEVNAALTVARSEVATAAADKWQFLTLDQAAVLAEFDGDTTALAELAKTAKTHPDQFGHVAQQLRDSAAERAQKETLVAELEAAGYRVADNYQEVSQQRWHHLSNWKAADGTLLTWDTHAECPHRAVRIDTELVWPAEAEAAWRAANTSVIEALRLQDGLGPDEVVAVEFDTDEEAIAAGHAVQWVPDQGYCTDPAEAGHKDRYTPGQMSMGSSRAKPEPGSEEAEQAKAERRALLANNRAWRSATVERTKHLKTVLARKSLTPKPLADAALAHVVDAIARGETEPEKTGDGHAMASRLLGLVNHEHGGRDLIRSANTTATPARRLVLALGMVLTGAEGEDGTYGSCADAHTWQRAHDQAKATYGNSAFHSGPGRAARYLAFLHEHTGYALSDLETLVAYGPPETTSPASPDEPSGATVDPGSPTYADAARARYGDPSAEVASESPAARRRRLINTEVVAGLTGPSGDGTSLTCHRPGPRVRSDVGCPVHGDLEVEDPPVTDPDEDEFDTTAAVEASADMDAHRDEATYE